MGCSSSKDLPPVGSLQEIEPVDIEPEPPSLPVDSPDTVKTIHSAIRWNKLDEVDTLVNCPELANVSDAGNGNSCLHIASQNGHFELVKLLVSRGADVNCANGGGQTALHMAVSYDIDEVRDFLLSKGADDSMTNDDGFQAKFGLSGEKDVTSVAGMMELFKTAGTEDELVSALTSLQGKTAELDKGTFASTGLKMKKIKKEFWTPEVQAKFVAVMQAL
mmetsp:Transcript_43780/g.70355  ORF Transcript_43780/g.70355 Transcript_43780/m.70355 type:complete len:219 (-) Transcript_43780:640-1296(-)